MIEASNFTFKRSLRIHTLSQKFSRSALVNFIATEKGLEDQLLAKIVNVEKPELEAKKQELVDAFNQYMVDLRELENELLERLANAPEDILSDIPLIEGLEATRKQRLRSKLRLRRASRLKCKLILRVKSIVLPHPRQLWSILSSPRCGLSITCIVTRSEHLNTSSSRPYRRQRSQKTK